MHPSKKSKTSNPTVIPFISDANVGLASLYQAAGTFAPISSTSQSANSVPNTQLNLTPNSSPNLTPNSPLNSPPNSISNSTSTAFITSKPDQYVVDRTTVHRFTVNPLSGPYQPIKSVIGNKRTFTESNNDSTESFSSSTFNVNKTMFSRLNIPIEVLDPEAKHWKQNKITLHLHNDLEIKYKNETIVLASKSILMSQFKKLEQDITSSVYAFEGSEEQKQLFVRMICIAGQLSKSEFTGMSLLNYDIIKFMDYYGMTKSLYNEFIKICIGYELGIPKKALLDPIYGSDNGLLQFNLLSISYHDTDNLSIARQQGTLVTDEMLCTYFAVKLQTLGNAARLFDSLEDIYNFKIIKTYICYVQTALLAKKLLKQTMFIIRTFSNNYINGLLSTIALGLIDY
jgi:hypothetical protein